MCPSMLHIQNFWDTTPTEDQNLSTIFWVDDIIPCFCITEISDDFSSILLIDGSTSSQSFAMFTGATSTSNLHTELPKRIDEQRYTVKKKCRIINPLRVYERQIPFHCIKWKKWLSILRRDKTKRILTLSLIRWL